MGRQLAFDRTQALALAVDAFWRNGYAAQPALELSKSMGLAKSSLYNTFGSKKSLFLEALDHYSQEQRAHVLALSQSGDLLRQLRKLLIEIASDNSAGRGCFLVNSAAELGLRDEAVRQRVKVGMDGMVDAFATLIRAGQASGAIRPKINSAEHAVAFLAGIVGLRVLAKSGFSMDQLLPVIDTHLAGLSN